MKDFIDTHRTAHGVEPICKVLQIAPSGYRRHAARRRDPQRRCARAQRDDVLMPQIEQVWQANMKVYGADKVWRQLARQGTSVARCTVERLMRRQGLRGVMRGKGGAHDDQRQQSVVPAGQGQPAVSCRAAQTALGV